MSAEQGQKQFSIDFFRFHLSQLSRRKFLALSGATGLGLGFAALGAFLPRRNDNVIIAQSEYDQGLENMEFTATGVKIISPGKDFFGQKVQQDEYERMGNFAWGNLTGNFQNGANNFAEKIFSVKGSKAIPVFRIMGEAVRTLTQTQNYEVFIPYHLLETVPLKKQVKDKIAEVTRQRNEGLTQSFSNKMAGYLERRREHSNPASFSHEQAKNAYQRSLNYQAKPEDLGIFAEIMMIEDTNNPLELARTSWSTNIVQGEFSFLSPIHLAEIFTQVIQSGNDEQKKRAYSYLAALPQEVKRPTAFLTAQLLNTNQRDFQSLFSTLPAMDSVVVVNALPPQQLNLLLENITLSSQLLTEVTQGASTSDFSVRNIIRERVFDAETFINNLCINSKTGQLADIVLNIGGNRDDKEAVWRYILTYMDRQGFKIKKNEVIDLILNACLTGQSNDQEKVFFIFSELVREKEKKIL